MSSIAFSTIAKAGLVAPMVVHGGLESFATLSGGQNSESPMHSVMAYKLKMEKNPTTDKDNRQTDRQTDKDKEKKSEVPLLDIGYRTSGGTVLCLRCERQAVCVWDVRVVGDTLGIA